MLERSTLKHGGNLEFLPATMQELGGLHFFFGLMLGPAGVVKFVVEGCDADIDSSDELGVLGYFYFSFFRFRCFLLRESRCHSFTVFLTQMLVLAYASLVSVLFGPSVHLCLVARHSLFGEWMDDARWYDPGWDDHVVEDVWARGKVVLHFPLFLLVWLREVGFVGRAVRRPFVGLEHVLFCCCFSFQDTG